MPAFGSVLAAHLCCVYSLMIYAGCRLMAKKAPKESYDEKALTLDTHRAMEYDFHYMQYAHISAPLLPTMGLCKPTYRRFRPVQHEHCFIKLQVSPSMLCLCRAR